MITYLAIVAAVFLITTITSITTDNEELGKVIISVVLVLSLIGVPIVLKHTVISEFDAIEPITVTKSKLQGVYDLERIEDNIYYEDDKGSIKFNYIKNKGLNRVEVKDKTRVKIEEDIIGKLEIYETYDMVQSEDGSEEVKNKRTEYIIK